MSYSQVIISSGHSKFCPGMVDIINEVDEAIKVVNRVHDIIKSNGKSCYKYHDIAYSSSQNLANIVNFHNQYTDGVDVSIHFNAYKHTDNAMGVEVCYYNDSTLASQMSKAISDVSGLKNRGVKQRTELYFLRKTNKPAILIEVCFGDSIKDCQLYNANFESICQAIAKVLIGEITSTTTLGWKKNSTGWWYDLGDGKYPANKWMEIKKQWYYFDGNGYAYQSKWLKHKDKWYYFNADCKMVHGCALNIKGKNYVFGSDGVMLENTTVNVNENGELIL